MTIIFVRERQSVCQRFVSGDDGIARSRVHLLASSFQSPRVNVGAKLAYG